MSNTSLEDDVRNYYESESLAEDHVKAVLDVATHVANARKWKRVALAASVALVATVLCSVTLLVYRVGGESSAEAPMAAGDSPASVATDSEEVSEIGPQILNDATEDRYRLVAFRSHGDGCPHCRATSEVFAQVSASIDNVDVAFEQFDLSRVNERIETDRRIEQLHLTPLIEGRIETAFLALVDSQGKKIKEFKPSMSSHRIADMIRESIH